MSWASATKSRSAPAAALPAASRALRARCSTPRAPGVRSLAAPPRPAAAAAGRRRLLAVNARGGGFDPRRRGGGGGGYGGGRPAPLDTGRLAREYALPALGLLVAASLVGPLVGGLVFGALGLGVAIAGAAAFFSLSSIFVPAAAAVFGLPALMAGGMAAGVFATAAAGALLLPSLFQLVLIGGGLWLGATAAQALLGFGGGAAADEGFTVGPNGTIDVEARSVDDDWRSEMFKEQREREAELEDFDNELRRREERKRRY